jgi:DNA repair protein RadC
MNLDGVSTSTDLVWAAANAALDLDSLSEDQIDVLVDVACLLLAKRAHRDEGLSSPEDAKRMLKTFIGKEKHEVFVVIYLDHKHRMLSMVKHFQGTIDSAAVYPRVVMQKALELNASAAVLAHCHPSGVAEPSMADRRMTKRLQEALQYCDVRILDHIIVTTRDTYSFAENGLI